MQWSINDCINKMLEDYKNCNLDKPIYPSIQTIILVQTIIMLILNIILIILVIGILVKWIATFVSLKIINKENKIAFGKLFPK